MYGNGCAGSTASGVSTGKMRSSNTRVELGAVVVGEVVPVGELDAGLLERGRDLLGEDRGLARRRARRRASRIARSCSTWSRPSGGVGAHARPRAAPAGPDTRTWKNSSRFVLKIARNFARSSSGSVGSSASASTRALKSSHDSSRLR